jgi:hypothetical protein
MPGSSVYIYRLAYLRKRLATNVTRMLNTGYAMKIP